MTRTTLSVSVTCLFLLSFSLLSSLGCGPSGTAISFKAMMGTQAFSCGTEYKDVGTSKASFQAQDFRFYVHNVRLLSDGKEVPIKLVADGKWQTDAIALLDFEDKTGKCNIGTAETNQSIIANIPEGTYKGIRFTVGIPFESNHKDAFNASAPLNVTAMFWSWQGGYKFFRLDGFTPGTDDDIAYRFHIGSIGCKADADKNVSSCMYPNRAEVELSDFEPGKHSIVVDASKILANEEINKTPPDGQKHNGCMSGSDEPNCEKTFPLIGLTYKKDETNPTVQTIFSLTTAN
jgi:uncharacterized repeat protein (TIGR04052 family)